MNIEIDLIDRIDAELGGTGYSVSVLSVFVDTNLPYEHQEAAVIHEIVETYCKFLSHEKVEELSGYIQHGLELLKKERNGNNIIKEDK